MTNGPFAQPKSRSTLGALATWLLGLFGFLILVNVLTIANDIDRVLLFGDIDSRSVVDSGAARASDDRDTVVAAAQFFIYVTVAIVFVVWFHSAYIKLASLGARSPRYSDGWAAGAWFIPILNLFRPKQIANDIWRSSEPDAPVDQGEYWRNNKYSPLLNWWWGVYLLDGVVGNWSLRSYDGSDSQSEYSSAAWGDLVSSAVGIGAAVLAMMVILQIVRRQRDRKARMADGSLPPYYAPNPQAAPPISPPQPPAAGLPPA